MEGGARPTRADREIGHAGGYASGPTVICVAALHGNEPAGVRALDRVFRKILDHQLSVRGEFAGLVGNVAALERRERFVAEDMNRIWSTDHVDGLPGTTPDDLTSEKREQTELLRELERLITHAVGAVFVLDLHTASSSTAPFVILGDTLRNREFARRFPLPIVLGLEEHIRGTLMEHLSELGHIGVAVEGGRHEDAASVDRLESVTWLALVQAGCLEAHSVPDLDLHRERLRRAGEGIPSVLEIVHREPAGPDFEMIDRFENFQTVRRGVPVAREGVRVIDSPRTARVFLPRYQPVGGDGFFLARPVNP
ncbi:MAG TPA: succinylglutamate desuccinylase/aspartoacylase family protein, partial [bacterium]|nr:succinylglutamate desuccinylase/aspartoacylase family protein [bacterium]